MAFEFLYKDVPVIRFSSDSGCICQYPIPYDNNIIITAPHHGSNDVENLKVYDNIKGDNIIWVRTYHPTIKTPCDKFLNQPNRYCLNCPKIGSNQIDFTYDGFLWDWQEGNKCICEPSKSTP